MTRFRIGSRIRKIGWAKKVKALPTAMRSGNDERGKLYRSKRWRCERAAFLAAHPYCDCGQRASVVDHTDGHQHRNWRARFWNRARWKPMCSNCHAVKSARELAAWRKAGEGVISH